MEITRQHLYLALALGWFLGGCSMWYYFHFVRMLRTRREWYADQLHGGGVEVPADWDDLDRDAESNPNRRW